MVSMLKKIFGGIFALLVVLVVIVACFGEEESGGKADNDKSSKSSSKGNALINEYIDFINTSPRARDYFDFSSKTFYPSLYVLRDCEAGDKKACRIKELWNEIATKCKEGDTKICIEAANRLEVKRFYEIACKFNDGEGCYQYGDSLGYEGVKDLDKKTCDELNYGKACYRLVERGNYLKFEFFEKLYKEYEGSEKYETRSGYEYNEDNEEYKDRWKKEADKEYVRLLTKACDLGAGEGCNKLGESYEKEDRDTIKRNYATAKSWYDRACKVGYKVGCKNAEKIAKERGL